MSTTTNDGGPAFPSTPAFHPHSGNFEHPGAWGIGGMTLRQWYAGMALQGMTANSDHGGSFAVYASDAFAYADAMLDHEAPRQPEEA